MRVYNLGALYHIKKRLCLISVLALSFCATSLFAAGWISPDGVNDPQGAWLNDALAIDGSSTTYATDNNNRLGWGRPLEFTLLSAIDCDRVKIYSDFGYSRVDMIRVEMQLASDSSWTNVYEGVVTDSVWTEVTFPQLNVIGARYTFHYIDTSWRFWLYDFMLYENPPQVNLPGVETLSASSIEETSAIMRGFVNDDGGQPCSWRFQWGLTESYSSNTPWTGSLTSSNMFSKILTGLESNTTYHYRAQIQNSAGIASGIDKTFDAAPPGTGWVPPTGFTDPDNAWRYEENAFDDNEPTLAKCTHMINDPVVGPYIYLSHAPMTADKIRFYARDTIDIAGAQVDVYRDGAWVNVYDAPFADSTWITASFTEGTVTEARVRFESETAGVGFDWELNEFDFHRINGINISGTFDSTHNVSLAVDGTYIGTFTNMATNVFSFTASVGFGSKILVWYDDDNIPTNSGAILGLASDADMTNMNLEIDTLILRDDTGNGFSNGDFINADNGDADIPYSSSGNDITLADGIALKILEGTSYEPGLNNLTLTDNMTVDGTFEHTSGTITFNGDTTISGTGTQVFNNVTIADTLTSDSGLSTVSGNWVNNGTFNHNNGTIDFDGNTTVSGTSDTDFNNVTISGNLTGKASDNMGVAGNWINNGSFNHNSGTVNFNGTSTVSGSGDTTFHNLSIAGSSTLTGDSDTIFIENNWSNSGTYNHNNGTVDFTTSGTSSIYGDTTFYDFSSTVPGKQINFEAGRNQTVLDKFTLTGASGNNIILRSTDTTNKWDITFPNADQAVTYVDVRDSDANNHDVYVSGGNDSGNNVRWIFVENRYWVGGNGDWSDTSNWSVTSGGPGGASVPTINQLAVFDSNSSGTCTIDTTAYAKGISMEAGTTTTIDQGSNIISLNNSGFIQTAGTFNGGSGAITNAGILSISGGSFTSTSGTLEQDNSLFFNGGTFNHNNGTIDFTDTASISGTSIPTLNSITIASTGELTAPANLSLDGSFINNGSFDNNNGLINFTGTSSIGGSAATIFNDLSISGTLTGSTGNISVAGSWTNNGTFNHNSGTVTFSGTTEISGTSTSSFNNVTISGMLTAHENSPIEVAGDWINNGSFVPNFGSIVFDGNSTIGGSSVTDFNDITIDNILNGAPGTMRVAGDLVNNGSFNHNNGTVVFNGNTSISGNTIELNNSELWGTLTAPASELLVKGNWANYGTFNNGGGTVVMTGTTLLSGSDPTDFNNLVISNSLTLETAGRIGDSTAVNVIGTLNLNDNDETVASITGDGSITLGSGQLTTAGNTSTTYDGTISGSGSLVKSGSGTLTLAGANTYSGGTTISAGTLQGTTASIQGDITNNSNLTFNQGSNGTYAGAVSGTGSLTKSGSGTLTLSGNSTYAGTTTLAAGNLNVTGTLGNTALTSSSGTTLGGTGTLGGGTTIDSGSTISPDTTNSVGQIDLSSTLALNGLYVHNATWGPLYDLINASGAVTGSGAIDVQFLSGFAPSDSTNWMVIAGGPGSDYSNITNNLTINGASNSDYSLEQVGDDLFLNFTNILPSITINNVTVDEGDSQPTNAVFTLTLSAISGSEVTVLYATSDGTAATTNDYVATAGVATITAGQTTTTVTVAVNPDALDEASPEIFYLDLSSPTNALLADIQGQASINDNDPLPAASVSDATVTEGDSGTVNAIFDVFLDGISGRSLSVNYATADNSASAPADYTADSGTLVFSPGQTNQTVTITVNGDTEYESPSQTFYVNLSGATNVTVLDGQGIGTITDDDSLPVIAVNTNGTIIEGSSGTTNLLVEVFLTEASASNTTVNFTTVDDTAVSPDDFASTNGVLIIPAGQTNGFITVVISSDNDSEGVSETFFLNISSPGNATLGNAQIEITLTDDDISEIALYGNATEITNGDTTPSLADFTDFGSVTVGLSTVSSPFVITNSGDSPLYLTDASVITFSGPHPNDFSATALPSTNIAPADFSSFTIEFDPTAGGSRTAVVSIANNDLDEGSFSFTVAGAASEPSVLLLHDVLFDNEETPDQTPSFEFTGFDSDGNAGIVYEIRWSLNSDFSSGVTTKISTNDAGFLNTVSPGDTGLFNEGERVRYTIQDGDMLANSNPNEAYYWQVRAKDASLEGGSGVWGLWSETNSFRVNTSRDISCWVQTTDEQFNKNTMVKTETSNDRVETQSIIPKSVMLAYGDNEFGTPKYRMWDGSAWGGEQSALSVGAAAINWVVLKACPVRDEYILATVDSTGAVKAQVWDGTSWGDLLTVSTSANGAVRGLDVAYESVSGDAILVASDGDADPTQYIWDGSSWTGPATVNVSSAGDNYWIKLASNPNKDELGLITVDANRNYRMGIWNGSAWGNEVTPTDVARDNLNPGMAVEFMGNGKAMFITADSIAGFWYRRIWNGSGWDGEVQERFANGQDDLYWATLKANPNDADQLAFGFIDRDNDIWAARWDDGAGAWQGGTELDAGGNSRDGRCVDVDFETTPGNEGNIIAAYSDTAAVGAKYRKLPSGSTTWDAEQTVSSIQDSFVAQTRRAGDGQILAVYFDDVNTQYDFSAWNGTNWTTTQTIETESSVSAAPFHEPFMMAPRLAPLDVPTITSTAIDFDWVWRTVGWDSITFTDDETDSDVRYDVQYWTGSDWANTTITNHDSSPIDISGLNPSTYNEIRLVAHMNPSNSLVYPYMQDWTVCWSSPPPTAVDNNIGADNIKATTATLTGNLTSTGGTATTAIIYWGDSDGGTNAAAWSNSVSVGILPEGVFTNDITGLLANKTYFYRCFASNRWDIAWAGAATNFTTAGPTVEFASTGSSADEASTPITVDVDLSATSAVAVTVNYAATGGTANGSGEDYTLSAGTLTIPAGSVSDSFDISIEDDAFDEFNETVIVTLSSPTNCTLGSQTSYTHTIQDNDAEPTLSFSSAPYSIDESGGSQTVTVTLSEESRKDITLDYITSNGTADGTDYGAVSGLLTWLAGSTGSRTFNVVITNDVINEPTDETINVSILNPTNAVISGSSSTTISIIDDDGAAKISFANQPYTVNEGGTTATVELVMNKDAGIDATVVLATSDNTASNGLDYTGVNTVITWTNGTFGSKFINIPITQDQLDEDNESLFLTLSSPTNAEISGINPTTLTINDDDPLPTVTFTNLPYTVSEAGGSIIVSAAISAEAGRNVSVNFATVDGTATNNGDYSSTNGTLTWLAGDTSVKTFTVPIFQDDLDENIETVLLSLSGAVNCVAGTNVNISITDDDPLPTAQFTTTFSSGSETSSPALVQMELDEISGRDVTVQYEISGTASNGQDYTVSASSIIPEGSSNGYVNITVNNDLLDEYDETISLLITNIVNANIGTTTNHTFTILDDDTPPTVSFSGAPYFVNEGATQLVVDVILSEESGRAVLVDIGTSDGTATNSIDYGLTNSTLSWAVGQTGTVSFAVAITNDTLYEGSETFTLTLSSPGNATIDGDNPVTVTIVDDDTGLPTVDNYFGASEITTNSATLRGELTDDGGENCDVYIFWGTSDGGTNQLSWANEILVDNVSASIFSTNVTGLSTNQLYYYRAAASNSQGISWAPFSETFTPNDPPLSLLVNGSMEVQTPGVRRNALNWTRSDTANLRRVNESPRTGTWSMRFTETAGIYEYGSESNSFRLSWNGQYSTGGTHPAGGIRPGFVLSGETYLRQRNAGDDTAVFTYGFNDVDSGTMWMTNSLNVDSAAYQALTVSRPDPLSVSDTDHIFRPELLRETGQTGNADDVYSDDYAIYAETPRLTLDRDPSNIVSFANTVLDEHSEVQLGVRNIGYPNTVLYGAYITSASDLTNSAWDGTAWFMFDSAGGAFTIESGDKVSASSGDGWYNATIRFTPPSDGWYTGIVRIATTDPVDRYTGGGTINGSIVYEEYTLSAYCPTKRRYWVSAAPGNWSDTANWSDTSGGAGGFSVPGPTDRAIIDGVSGFDGDINIDTAVDVRRLTVSAGYTGTITQNGNDITVGVGGAVLSGGTFSGGTGTITANGTLTLSGSAFTSTAGDLVINDTLTFSSGSFSHNSGTVVVNGDTDIAAASINLNNLTINGTLTAPAGTLGIAGSLLNNGTFNSGSGTVNFNGYSAVTNLTTLTLNDVLIDGTLISPSGTLSVKGDWNGTAGTNIHNSGKISFNGASLQTVTTGGAFDPATTNNNVKNNWYELEILNTSTGGVVFADGFKTEKLTATERGTTLYFAYMQEETNVFEIVGAGGLNIQGEAGQETVLRRYGGSALDQWEIAPSGGAWNVAYVNVKDSINSYSNAIVPTLSSDAGNTKNWFMPTLAKLIDLYAVHAEVGAAVHWETALEMENAGFNVYRADSFHGPYSKLNESMIRGQGTSVTGAKYSFADSNALHTASYYYRVESVDYDENSEMFGPVLLESSLIDASTARPFNIKAFSFEDPSRFTIKCPTEENMWYVLQISTNLSDKSGWVNVMTHEGTGEETTFTNLPVYDQIFYRVKVLAPRE